MPAEQTAVMADDPDALTGHGEGLRALRRYERAIDAFTRESLAIEVATSLPGQRVAQVLARLTAERGQAPAEIVLDNGPELTSRALDQWAYERGVRLRFIEPGKPIQNGFNGGRSYAPAIIRHRGFSRCSGTRHSELRAC